MVTTLVRCAADWTAMRVRNTGRGPMDSKSVANMAIAGPTNSLRASRPATSALQRAITWNMFPFDHVFMTFLFHLAKWYTFECYIFYIPKFVTAHQICTYIQIQAARLDTFIDQLRPDQELPLFAVILTLTGKCSKNEPKQAQQCTNNSCGTL